MSIPPKEHPSLIQSFQYALEGLWFALKTERSFRIHLVAATLSVVIGKLFYNFSSTQWILLVLTILLVLVTELINTSIERTVDLITPDYNSLAKVAKDVAAGAVFVSAAGSVAVAFFLFYHLPTLQQVLTHILTYWYLWGLAFLGACLFIWLPCILSRTRKGGSK